MADYGVTATGFKRKRLADIKLEIEASLRANLGNFINTLPSSIFGQVIGIFSEREDAVWEAVEEVYNSQWLNSASGVPLQNVLGLVGVTKLNAAKSVQQDLYLFGTPGTIVPVNTQVRVAGNSSATFQTVASIQLVAGQDQIQRLGFSAPPTSGSYRLRYINEDTATLAFNATALDVQNALNALPKLDGVTVTGNHDVLQRFDVTFGGLSGKLPHAPLQVILSTLSNGAPVTLAWASNPQEAIPQGVVDAEALVAGPTAAPLYTLTEIVNPVTGLDRVLNLMDADVGRFLEDDNSARVRSSTAQAARGKGSPDAIRARLLEVEGVTQAIVFQNEGDTTDVNGLPPHSIRAYVQGGDDQDIREEIWISKAGGIKSDGLVTGTIKDSSGIIQPIKFSRPEVVPVYISITITKDSDWTSDGAAKVRAALAGYVNSLLIGADVIVYPKMISVLNSISGITDISIAVGTTSSPTTDNNIIIGVQQLARVVVPETDIVVTVNP